MPLTLDLAILLKLLVLIGPLSAISTTLLNLTSPGHWATQSLLILYKFMMVNNYIKFLQLIKGLWTGKAVLLSLTLICVIDLGPSHTVLGHCTQSHDGELVCQVKYLQLMKELWTRQADFSH